MIVSFFGGFVCKKDFGTRGLKKQFSRTNRKYMPRDQGGSIELAERIFFTYLELRSCLGSLTGEKTSFFFRKTLNPKPAHFLRPKFRLVERYPPRSSNRPIFCGQQFDFLNVTRPVPPTGPLFVAKILTF